MSSSCHILVVDDSATQLQQMRLLLEKDGFEVCAATGGQQAIDLINQDPPFLVITDLQMPEISGLDLVEILRGTHPSIPVIVTTSQGSEEVAADALRRGAASYVPKRDIASTLAPVARQVMAVGEASRAIQQTAKYTVEATIKMALESDESIVPKVIARIEKLLIEMDLFDEATRMQIGMSLDEALLNSIVHGNLEVSSELREIDGGAPYQELIQQRMQQSPYQDRKVYVEVRATHQQVRFVIRDEGEGFDCEQVGDPTSPENLEKCGGRGLFMIHAFMDEVSHNDLGNEIVMLKRTADLVAEPVD